MPASCQQIPRQTILDVQDVEFKGAEEEVRVVSRGSMAVAQRSACWLERHVCTGVYLSNVVDGVPSANTITPASLWLSGARGLDGRLAV